MTVIAYDGEMIAVDSQASYGGLIGESKKFKLLPSNRGVCLICGALNHLEPLYDWYEKKSDWPQFQSTDEWSTLIVFDRGVLKWFDNIPSDLVSMMNKMNFMAWGSGRDFAMGAMAKGANAEEAVNIACQLSSTCSGPVVTFNLKNFEFESCPHR